MYGSFGYPLLIFLWEPKTERDNGKKENKYGERSTEEENYKAARDDDGGVTN